jgi:branched-chain amino acid transport system substrate-binding protein
MSFGKAFRVCLIAASLAAVTACGSSSNSSSSSKSAGGGGGGGGGSTVDIYSSLPLQGATSAQTGPTVNGMKLALSQAGGKAGKFTVNYTSLDDSTAAKGNFDLGQCSANGRKAATDTKAVAYLGEFNSSCTEVSLPILNQAGVPMISPANTYVGLTTNQPSSMVAPGEPQKYYPTGTRTYLRIVPRDSIQGAADLMAMKQAGCKKVAEANDKTAYGAGIAQVVSLLKGAYGVSVASNTGIDPTAPNYRSYAATIKGQGADCFFFGGVTANGGVQIAKDVNAAIPKAKIFGPDGVCSAAWTSAKGGGVPAAIDPLMQCTVATLNLTSYPGGKSFLAAYKAKYGVANPDPYAIYGYEDMKVVLDTIKSLGAQGNSKSAVLKALFAIKARPSVLGTYGFDSNGDTTLKAYGLYKVGSDGNPAFFKALTPKVTS